MSDVNFKPSKLKPSMEGAKPFVIRPGWHRESGNADVHMRPAVEPPRPNAPKLENGHGELLRKAMGAA